VSSPGTRGRESSPVTALGGLDLNAETTIFGVSRADDRQHKAPLRLRFKAGAAKTYM